MAGCQKQLQRKVAYPMLDGISNVTVGSMRCSFNIQQAGLQWQLYKAGEAASCWSANISSEPLYSSLPATKCLYLQSACHFPLAGELVYYLARIYLGKTFQFKSAGTTVALARLSPCGSKRQELSLILKGRVSGGRKGLFSESRSTQYLKRKIMRLSFPLCPFKNWSIVDLQCYISAIQKSDLGVAVDFLNHIPCPNYEKQNKWELNERKEKLTLNGKTSRTESFVCRA